MAIPAVNATYLTAGPVASGQILAPNELSNLESAYTGLATFVLDGTLTQATLNFIDGTKTLSFTPSGIDASVVGGTQFAAAPVGIIATKVTDNTKGVIAFTGAGTGANTVTVLFRLVK